MKKYIDGEKLKHRQHMARNHPARGRCSGRAVQRLPFGAGLENKN